MKRLCAHCHQPIAARTNTTYCSWACYRASGKPSHRMGAAHPWRNAATFGERQRKA
jgi:hypothetical protein